MSIEWWEFKRKQYEVYISELVLEEIASGDPSAAPENSREDALHIGLAAAQGADYLLTWNFKHINNASTRTKIARVIESQGFACPILCSPEEL